MPQLGAVMKAVQPLVAGRADGGRVAAAVRARTGATVGAGSGALRGGAVGTEPEPGPGLARRGSSRPNRGWPGSSAWSPPAPTRQFEDPDHRGSAACRSNAFASSRSASDVDVDLRR